MKRLLLVLFLVLSFAKLAKQDESPVIVCCRNHGDGMGDYSSGLYMAMNVQTAWLQGLPRSCCPCNNSPLSIEEEIRNFFQTF